MYDYGDLFALSCSSTTSATTNTTDFFPYDPELTTPSPPIYPINPPSPLLIPTTNNEYLDSVHEITTLAAALKSEVGYSSSSSYGSPSSLPSCYSSVLHDHLRPSLVQRSLSSHSLQKDGYYHPIFSSLEESRREILDLESGPMRKVYSTGDLQTINTVGNNGRSESPLSQENCTIDGMNKVGRYSAEERKERIERYRSKRNQRNFTKKIKYACRKTLADSRPRIRGRFARNEEMGESSNNSQTQWNLQMGVDENDEEVDDIWINFYEAFSANLIPN
ncbi:CCT domain [Macleaya cordata]|uniref:CCT domain n=1 Tax=Macleaya cordata TaxID=56857 RepID=A0A200R674_MACCD|nr:CCT domain [Macleaya cordata]